MPVPVRDRAVPDDPLPYFVMLITAFGTTPKRRTCTLLIFSPRTGCGSNITDIVNRGVPRFLLNSLMLSAVRRSSRCGVRHSRRVRHGAHELSGEKGISGLRDHEPDVPRPSCCWWHFAIAELTWAERHHHGPDAHQRGVQSGVAIWLYAGRSSHFAGNGTGRAHRRLQHRGSLTHVLLPMAAPGS